MAKLRIVEELWLWWRPEQGGPSAKEVSLADNQLVMWGEYNRIWKHYRPGILASEPCAADFLSDYQHFLTLNRAYLGSSEVADLQKYKLVREPRRLRQYEHKSTDRSFIFFYCLN